MNRHRQHRYAIRAATQRAIYEMTVSVKVVDYDQLVERGTKYIMTGYMTVYGPVDSPSHSYRLWACDE